MKPAILFLALLLPLSIHADDLPNANLAWKQYLAKANRLYREEKEHEAKLKYKDWEGVETDIEAAIANGLTNVNSFVDHNRFVPDFKKSLENMGYDVIVFEGMGIRTSLKISWENGAHYKELKDGPIKPDFEPKHPKKVGP